jgi:hypothetical protein
VKSVESSGHTGLVAIAGLLIAGCGLSLAGTGDLADGGAAQDSTDPDLDGASASGDGPSQADHTGSAPDAPTAEAEAVSKDASTKDVAVKDASEEQAPAMDGAPKDASAVDVFEAAPPPPTVVQSQANDNDSTNDSTIGVMQIGAGHLVVGLASYDDTGQQVTSVTDGKNTYVSTNQRSYASGQACEIWYARNTTGGPNSVSVSMSNNVHLSVWVLEVAGLADSGQLDHGNAIDNGPSASTVTVPPITPTSVPAFIVAAAGSDGNVTGVNDPFTFLAVEHGNSGAYYIATTAGPYGPVFQTSGAGWNVSIADFL